MRTITKSVYKFNELPENIQDRIIEKWAENETDYNWGNDAIESLKAFVDHMGGDLRDYSIDWLEPGRSTIRVNVNEEMDEDELKSLIESMGSYNPETLRGLGDCKFTGYTADDNLADGAREAYFKGERDVRELINAGFEQFLQACREDFEYQMSAKCFRENYADNDEYYEDGEIA